MRSLCVNCLRGDIIEKRHRIHAVAMQGDTILLQCGNSDLITPMRSAAKPFMVWPQIETSKKCGINLTDKQIALMVSSHNGELDHRNEVNSILALSNSTADDLFCGTHFPFFDWLYTDYFMEKDTAKRQLFHNCSGKHAGMLLLAELTGNSKKNYYEACHPVQKSIINSVKDILRITEYDYFSLALDGCGVPTYCVSLQKIAASYKLLCKDERLCRVLTAVLNEPHMIAGSERIETDIIRNCHFFAKSGSGGIFCVLVPNEDISIALKAEDGDDDAAEAAAAEILDVLGLLTPDNKEILEGYRRSIIYTSTGVFAGQLAPTWSDE